jgi:hypothetical protein
MIQARAVAPTPDLCCLPSPYKIPQGVAGMAFNFSKIEVAHRPALRKAPLQQTAQSKAKDSVRA